MKYALKPPHKTYKLFSMFSILIVFPCLKGNAKKRRGEKSRSLQISNLKGRTV